MESEVTSKGHHFCIAAHRLIKIQMQLVNASFLISIGVLIFPEVNMH